MLTCWGLRVNLGAAAGSSGPGPGLLTPGGRRDCSWQPGRPGLACTLSRPDARQRVFSRCSRFAQLRGVGRTSDILFLFRYTPAWRHHWPCGRNVAGSRSGPPPARPLRWPAPVFGPVSRFAWPRFVFEWFLSLRKVCVILLIRLLGSRSPHVAFHILAGLVAGSERLVAGLSGSFRGRHKKFPEKSR